MTRFPNSHLAPPGLIQNRPVNPSFQNANLNVQQQMQQQQRPMMMQPQQEQEQKKQMTRPLNQMELQFAYQDAWRVCNPDFKRPFTSLEDACERLLPYHVVADYEAEEDDMILHSDTTSQGMSRSQQWDDNIAAKVGEFTDAFEKQVQAFNMITQKRRDGELRSEERFIVEQFLLMEERKACSEVKSELDREMKAQEAKLRMAAMAQGGQVMGHNPLRGNAFGNYGEQQQQQQGRCMNPDEMMMRMRSWMNNNNNNNNSTNGQREEKEPVEDFLNDEETGQRENWRGNGDFDLNTR
ncbi:unnamed protein product [Eruca vesicaria subsp. sativa]|uniref:GLTSCR protein conserved domain-containing protein n=1 Tax=Eruca vesicaria subsp. sativa TaxID=29727 RepID=A0ABC8KLG0_ERUVS|nr:unnamed protein product [Eruca vesicaria subsp. sativa]